MKRRFVVIGSASLIVLVGAALIGQSAVGAAPAPVRTFLSPTENADPADITAAHEERIANFPPAQPIDPDAVWATELQVIRTARLFAQSPISMEDHLSDSDRAKLPASAVLVRYEEFAHVFLEGGSDPSISPDRPVWVVVVHGTIRDDSALVGTPIEDITHDVYTVVYDAPTGDLILYSSGGDAFAAGLREKSTIEHE
ncbi:hypothetical protein HQQ81_06575 [Microbacteriaceae bacterium VKM Ac-2854]|nr:hypothetical protein [Microbacteriaceae bacterium VKM Ac-2854]